MKIITSIRASVQNQEVKVWIMQEMLAKCFNKIMATLVLVGKPLHLLGVHGSINYIQL